MTRYDPGDVVLVQFPFIDLTSTKKPPALILNPAKFTAIHGDVVVMPLTSQYQKDRSFFLDHWSNAGLPKPTWLKPVIGTLAGHLVTKRLGKLDGRDIEKVKRALAKVIAQRFLV